MIFYCLERTYDSSRTGSLGKMTFCLEVFTARWALFDTHPSTLQIIATQNSDLSVSVQSLYKEKPMMLIDCKTQNHGKNLDVVTFGTAMLN